MVGGRRGYVGHIISFRNSNSNKHIALLKLFFNTFKEDKQYMNYL